MLVHKLVSVPRIHIILKHVVCGLQVNPKFRNYGSLAHDSYGHLYITPKRLLKIPYALTVPEFENNEEAKGHLKELDDLYPEMLDTLKILSPYAEIPETIDHLKIALEYMVPYGKRSRSLRILENYKRLAKPEDQTPEHWKRLKILCWVVEILHSMVLMADDVMDGSEFRRKKKVWWKQPGVGMRVVNDVSLYEGFAYTLLKMYWKNHHSYVSLVHMMQKLTFFTELGQSYDYNFKNIEGKINFNNFTIQKYIYCTKYKTMCSTIAPSFFLSLIAANIYNPRICKNIEPIFIEIGVFFQCLNDFKDLFHDQGEVITTSKQPALDRDIPSGQLTWFAVKVLESGTKNQKKKFVENYGRDDPKSVETIYRIYEEMKLDEVLLEYEESSFRWLEDQICRTIEHIPPIIVGNYVEAIYKRKPDV